MKTIVTTKKSLHRFTLVLLILTGVQFMGLANETNGISHKGMVATDTITFEMPEKTAFQMDELELSYAMGKWHKILGYSAALTGLATGIMTPGVAGEGVHKALGVTAAGLSAATIVLGYGAYRNDISPADGLSSNIIHAVLGVTGGLMMMSAPLLPTNGTHQFVGEAGAVLMAVSVFAKIVY